MSIDPCKIAFLTEALDGFSHPELQFLASYIHVRLTRLNTYLPSHHLGTAGTVGQVGAVGAVGAVGQVPPTARSVIKAPTSNDVENVINVGQHMRDEDLVPPPLAPVKPGHDESAGSHEEIGDQGKVEPQKVSSEVSAGTVDHTKKNVKWADIVTASSPANSSGQNVKHVVQKKVYQKTPQSTKTPPAPASKSVVKNVSGKKKIVERHSVASEPRDEPYTGRNWPGFCGDADHGCVYTFRDPCSEVSADGRPAPPPRRRDYKDGDSDSDEPLEPEEPEEPVAWDPDHLDSVRFDRGKIYDNQLYVRGWNPEIVSWEMVHDRIWSELSDYQLDIHQIYIDPKGKGFGFITLSNHDVATKCQKVLVDLPSFYGNQLLVNFATSRKVNPQK